MPGRGRRGGYDWGNRQRRREGRRETLEEVADRLEEAGARLRSKARGGGSTIDDRRSSMGSSGASVPSGASGASGSSGSRRLSGSGDGSDSWRLSGSPDRSRSRGPSRHGAPARKPAKTRLETLQRRFAEGRITMEQYERELDKLYGLS
ncbi:MAG: hypothetical protein P8099_19630 [Gemmatimonadota bacterium]